MEALTVFVGLLALAVWLLVGLAVYGKVRRR